MQIPGPDHPDRWLYDKLATIEKLLFAVALRLQGHEQYAATQLEEAQKLIER